MHFAILKVPESGRVSHDAPALKRLLEREAGRQKLND